MEARATGKYLRVSPQKARLVVDLIGGKKAGEAAVLLAKGTALADLPGTVMFMSPGGNNMVSYLLTPIPITKDNLKDVLDAGWITKDVLCKDVTAGSVPGC